MPPPDLPAGEPAFDRLLAALALGEGFQFHVVAAASPRQVQTLLTGLVAVLPARHQRRARGCYLAPYESLPRDKPFAAEKLIAYLDEQLAGLPPGNTDERLVVALDATPANPASEEEMAAWQSTFRHMNEQRNGFIRQIDAELLLCLPPCLEISFAHEAADFWSIRGVSATLPTDFAASAPLVADTRFLALPSTSSPAATESPPTPEELAAARTLVEQAPGNREFRNRLMILLGKYGDDQFRRLGDSKTALAVYREALSYAEQLGANTPEDELILHNQSLFHDKIGEVLAAHGYLRDALAAYNKGLAMAEVLAARNPDNAEWQRDLYVSYSKIGGAFLALDDKDRAYAALCKSLEYAQALAIHAPENTERQSDLSLAHAMVGEVLAAQGDNIAALTAFRNALDHLEPLAAQPPSNLPLQMNLSALYDRIGEQLLSQADSTGALNAFRKGLAIREALAERDFDNHDLHRSIAISQDRIGGSLLVQGDKAGALSILLKSLATTERLAAHDPHNAERQSDLIVSHALVAEAGGGEEHLRKAVAIGEALASTNKLAPRQAMVLDTLIKKLAK